MSVWTNIQLGLKVLIKGGNVPDVPAELIVNPSAIGWTWTIPNPVLQAVTAIPVTAFGWTWTVSSTLVIATQEEIGLYVDTYSDTY